MRTSIVVAGVLLMTLVRNGCAADHDSKTFLAEAVQDGIAEVRVCKLALQKSQNADVKNFAQRMIADHSRMDGEITKLAQKKGVTLPSEPGLKQKATYAAVSVLSGGLFDREFMSHNVSDHEQDVKDFREQAEQGTDPEVKAFAAKAEKTLQTHLELSKQGQQKVTGAGKKS